MRTNQSERRHCSRVNATGSVFVYGPDRCMRGRLRDLAQHGAAFVLDPGDELETGMHLRLEIRLDGSASRWLRVRGHVIRVDSDPRSCVVELDSVPGDFEDLVQDELLAALECERRLHVLVVDARRTRCSATTRAFRRAGCHVTSVATPLEAVSGLDDSGLHVWLAAIADTRPAGIADDLRAFIHKRYPSIATVILEDESTMTAQVENLLEARGA